MSLHNVAVKLGRLNLDSSKVNRTDAFLLDLEHAFDGVLQM
jgi:hypothetical protein